MPRLRRFLSRLSSIGLGAISIILTTWPMTTAFAQPPTPASSEEAGKSDGQATTTVSPLTVVAPTHEPAKLAEMISRFVEAHGVPGRIDQLSRWGAPLCPKTEGLSDPFNRYVSVRLSQVAAFVKAPVDKHPNRNFPCKTNVLVVFTTKPQELMDDVRKHHPNMLGFHYAAQTERLARFIRPMQAWYITGTKNSEGPLVLDTEFDRLPGGQAGSRLTAHLQNQIIGALVVIDARQIVGRQIGGVADNVAMLVLSHTQQSDRCSDLPTILDFMVAECQANVDVEQLTDYDVAYLKALYAVDPEEYLHAQRSEIATRVMKELKSTPATYDEARPPQPRNTEPAHP